MPVHVARYQHSGEIHWGVLRGDAVAPIPGSFETTAAFLGEGAGWARAHRDAEGTLPLDAVKVLCPVTRHAQVICQGLNYADHLREAGMDPAGPPFNTFFRKASSSLVAADAPIVRPPHVQLLDHEIELGLVVGREIDGPVVVGDGNLLEVLAGIVIAQDVSARDVQIPQGQFYKGKSYRSFAPVGPWLCLLEPGDVPLLSQLEMTLTVNGELRQRGTTGDMLHGPAATLTELSGIQDLHPGDLISTGTPAGVALTVPGGAARVVANLLPDALRWKLFLRSQLKRPGYLETGDVIESRIASGDGRIDLGVQRNVVE